MPDWLDRQASTLPHRPALLTGSVRWTFQELDRQARRVARQLASLGVAEGTRVAVLLRNGAPFVSLTHALVRLGAVMVPLNVRLAGPELAWQLADADPAVLIHDQTLEAAAAEATRHRSGVVSVELGILDPRRVGAGETGGLDGIRCCTLTRDGLELPEAPASLRDRIDLSSVQGIVYTSATSGRPKGVLLTYGNHWWSAIGSVLTLGLRQDDRWLAPLPLYHVGGLAIIWRGVIYGIPVVVHETFEPDAVNREIDDGAVTIVSVVSTMLERILDARGSRPFPPSLRCVLLGGGPASPALLAACAERGISVAPTYGLTETASQVATLAPGEATRKPGSSGRPLIPTCVRIDLGGRPATAGEVGEILVGGPTVMRGYANRPDDTALALRDGWMHTGDLGYLDDEGYLYVVDRRDDLVVTGGENVYPAEVEGVLREHPSVADAGVIGLPDPAWGQIVTAVVTLRPETPAPVEEIREFCARRLAQYKVPRRIWISDEVPRAIGGKLLRRSIRAWAGEMLARERGVGSAPLEDRGGPGEDAQ